MWLFSVILHAVLIGFALMFVRFLKALWTGNQDYARGKPGSGWAAATVPIMACFLFFGLYLFLVKAKAVIRPSEARATHGNLGAIKSTLSIYYGDTEGERPEDFTQLTKGGRYLSEIPQVRTIEHSHSNEVVYLPSLSPMDTGAWGYVNNPDDKNYGTVFVDCTHKDSRGQDWVSKGSIREMEKPGETAQAVLERLSSGEGPELAHLYALGALGPEAAEAVPALIKRLSSERIAVRSAAVYALSRMGSAARPALNDLKRLYKNDPSFSVRLHAEKALHTMGEGPAWWKFW